MLRIITGRSGSGKTGEMLRMMQKCENSIYIVPEQYSFAAEKKITRAFNVSGMGNPCVYSLRRLAYYLEELYGGNTKRDISSAGKVMIMGDIVRRKADELSLYGSSAKRGDMARQSAAIVTTFKEYSVTKEKIENAMAKTKNSLLYKKLNDCKIICEEYDEFLKSGFRDGDDLIEGLKNHIENTSFMADKHIFIDSFQAFTPLEYEVILKLMQKCKSVTVSLCIGSDADEFVTATRTKNRLIRLAEGAGVIFEGETRLTGAMYTACDEIKALEKSFFDIDTVYKNKTDKVRIHCAKNEYTEIEAAAREVERLCREEQLRYRDIVIVAREAESYEKSLTRVFQRFGIPLFLDKKTPLASEAAAIFLISAIKIISRGWKNENVFAYMKTAFSPIDKAEADELENYCLAAGVKMRDWKREEPWDMPVSVKAEESDKGYLEKIDQIRKRLITPVLNLESKIKTKRTGREMCIAFYEFILECGVAEKINLVAQRMQDVGESVIAARMRQVYDLMISVLESFDEAFCDRKISSEDFVSILTAGLESVEIGTIPQTTDCVCAGSIDRARGHGAKAVIVIGAQEGKFPLAPKGNGIFTDADRHELMEYSIELPPDTMGMVYMEESLVYSALTCATDYLYVSYQMSGESKKPSTIVKRLEKVFPSLVKTYDGDGDTLSTISSAKSTYENFAVEYAKVKNGEKWLPEWLTAAKYYNADREWQDKIAQIDKYTNYKNKTELIKSELLSSRYGREMSTSVSRLEGYAKCPFMYFAQVTLGLKERKELEVTAADSGTFLHEFVDLFGKGLKDDGKNWRDIDEGYIDKKTEEIALTLLGGLNEHLIKTSPRIRHLFAELKRIAKRSVTVLCEHMKKGAFEPLGYEIVFDKNGDFKPITIDLPNGQKALLRGRVDRCDIFESEKGKFVRIIDYKSGEKKFSLSSIYHGFDLQLAVYLTAICENGNYQPAGMLYFKINDPIIDAPASAEDDYVKGEIVKKLKMDGLVLSDAQVLEAMDYGYASGSEVIPVKLKKDGSFTQNSHVATAGEFAALSKHVKTTVKRLCNEILSGNASISPVKGACEWCQMKSICAFDTAIKGCSFRSVDDISDKDVLTKIKEEQN